MGSYLVVGASGYVGTRFVERLLDQGHRVRGVVRNNDSEKVERLAARGMVVWTGDVTRTESLHGVAEGVEYVYNLTSAFALETGPCRRTFVDGNRNLIGACSRSRSVRSYIFASSFAPYGDAVDALVDEDSLVAPTYALGEVMAEAELAVMDAVQQHHFPAIILRLAAIYGPGRDFIDIVRNSTLTIYGDGRNYLPHIHVEDLLTVLEQVAIAGQPGAIYNVGDDEPLRQIELYAEVRRRLGMLPPRTYSPETALHAGIDPSIVGRSLASVRMSNRRLKHDLNLALRYPSCWNWLNECLPLPLELEVAAS